MNELGYFIDIERLNKWIYRHPECIRRYDNDKDNDDITDENKIITKSNCKNWYKYKTFPRDNSLKDIYKKMYSVEEINLDDYRINIADLMICVNNAIDINKGQKLQTITSTGKKVMVLLLLGRILDGNNKNGFFTATEKKDSDVWSYLASFSDYNSKTGIFYYFPGRTVSLNQLKSVGKSYKNGIKDTAIPDGIRELIRVGLVACVDEKKELYKLDFDGCQRFLKNNK